MGWTVLDTWILVVGALAAMACALPGCFLVLRRLSMMGDAISHAVLPGLAIAFLVTGSRASVGLFLGAALAGLLTALLTQWVHRWGRVEQGAAMGVVFTSLFALGLLLIEQGAENVEICPTTVLYGAIELTPLDVVASWMIGGVAWEIPRAVLILAVITLLNAGIVILFFKELKISAFDPALAATQGLRPERMHQLLMVMVAVTTVAAFEAVGSILVIALLVGPPAAAFLLARSLGSLLLLSILFGVTSAAFGHLGAILLPPLVGFQSTSTAGMMAAATGVVFLLAAILAKLRHQGS